MMKKGRKGLAALLAMVMIITMMGGFNVAQKTEVNADEKTYYAGNPIITSMFTADPSAHVWEKDGRIYIYASHDIFPSRGCDLMDKYHVFSSDNMVTWRDEGEILSSDDVSWGREEGGFMWAPDATYENGTYYFYFPHPTGSGDAWNNTWRIGIAKSNSPASGFKCADDGYVKKKDGSPYVTGIDPCIFKDDDGSYYLYTGGGAACYVAKMQSDMQTLAEEPVRIDQTLTDFHEGMWVFKKDGLYYAMYADNTAGQNLMRYSTANSPYGPWKEGGIVLEGTGCDTTHGSITEYKGHWYLFYHNCEISGNGTLRSVCIDEVKFNSDGSIQTVQQTKQGVANVDYVDPADIAGNNSSPDPAKFTEKIDYSISNAEIGGGATRGGEAIENLHYEGSYVEWNNINGEKGGQAMLTVYYGTPDGATALVNSSGDTAGDGYFLKFNKTTAWGDFSGVATCFIDLNPGTNNTVKLTCGMGGVNITGMSISLPDQNAPQETTLAPTQKPTEKPTEASTQAPEYGKCDLVVTDIDTEKNYYTGEEAVFTVTIKNQGTATSASNTKHGVALSVDGQVVNWCDTFFGPLKPGEEVTVSMNGGPNTKKSWTVVSGTHTVSAHVNDTRDVDESDTSNNIFSKTMTFTDKPSKSADIRVDGYQISTTLGGFRTVYSVSDSNAEVESLGLVYGLSSYVSESDMVVGSSNNKVFDYAATEKGRMDMSINGDEDYESYTMTLQFDKQQVAFLSEKMSVRAYAKLKDGSVIYSKTQSTSIYDTADYLYKNLMMNTLSAHNYLFNNILSVVTPSYKEIDYNWNSAVVTPNEI